MSKSSEPRGLLSDGSPRIGLHEFGGGELLIEVEVVEVCASEAELIVGIVVGRAVVRLQRQLMVLLLLLLLKLMMMLLRE